MSRFHLLVFVFAKLKIHAIIREELLEDMLITTVSTNLVLGETSFAFKVFGQQLGRLRVLLSHHQILNLAEK